MIGVGVEIFCCYLNLVLLLNIIGCGLLLSEIFLDDDRGGPSRGLLQALSLSEGKQRSASEYRLLLERHGFITAHIRHTGNLLDAMLSIKA